MLRQNQVSHCRLHSPTKGSLSLSLSLERRQASSGPHHFLFDRTQHLGAATILATSSMASDKGRPLPKFGEWDVNNPASSEGFTVIFNKARDEKKSSSSAVKIVTPRISKPMYRNDSYPQYPRKKKWFCCG